MPNLLAGKSLPDFSDYLRKGTRVELKKLMVELEPQKSVKPLIVEALAPLFDKQGALVKDAHQQIPQLESVLNYHLSLYQPCGGIEASAQGIKEFLQRLIELPNEATSESTMPGHLPDTQQELAQHLTNDWFSNINKTWRKEADSSIRRTSAEIGQAVLETYNQLWKEINPTLQPGDVNAKPVSAKALAQRFASVTAPTLMSKQGNQSYGKLALILEPAFQLSKRSALLNEYEDHRNKALLAQTVIQALFTCFVLGNLLFFVVFNTFARLDADFQGPNGETRLDFGEMKRGINRWIQRQLGREVTEPTNRTIHPKVSLEYSFGSAAAQFQQKVMGASAAVAPQRSLAAVVNVAPALQPSNYLKQTILNIMPFASAQEERP
jgi:hypothetical protein